MVIFKKILEANLHTNRKLKSEKDAYKLLQEQVFHKSFKLYTPILRGFPDFIVISLKNDYKDYLKPGFYEIKFNRGRLSPHQISFLSVLASAFPVYLFVVKEDYSFVVHQIVVE